MRLPPLTALRAFEAAARAESFTLAAHELCVTTGAVSRQMRLLESHLGVQLFARHHRKVVLTLAGQRYLEVVGRAFAELGAAGEALERSERQALVRIDCVPTLSMYWLMPRLAAYRERHPEIAVDTTTGLGPLDPGASFDLAIRRDPRHFSGLEAAPLMTEWCTPVCSRGFAERHRLSSAEDLLRAPAIRIRARDDLWPTWTRKFRLAAPPAASALILDHTFAALQAAEDGLGVAVLPLIFVQKQVAAGRLFAPFPGMLAESGEYFVLARAGSEGAAAGLRAWLLEQGALTMKSAPFGPAA